MISNKKVYDCFTFFNELELLELRMAVMDKWVDHYVLVESTRTFTGKPKELFFDKNKADFDTSKIIHVIVDDMPHHDVGDNYEKSKANEVFQRECIKRGLTSADPEDIVMITDVDEIINMNVVEKNLHLLDRQISFALKVNLFYFYVNYYSRDIPGPVMCKFGRLTSVQKFRVKMYRRIVEEVGGWHYSYLGGMENIRLKIDSYAMTKFNNSTYTSDNHINECLESGSDLFGRSRMDSKFVDIDRTNSPAEMDDFVKKYPHLMKKK